jgi:uncharacterized RDD family membrane protein YckC
MEYEDTITIATPEGVELHMVLAGAGSRASAAILDSLVKAAVFIAVILLARAAHVRSSAGTILLIVLGFFLLFAYDVLFEVLGSGRTPGKRWSGLRVVRDGGRPIGAGASSVRNILRVIDILPGVYGVGLLTVALTKRNQRLGDLAAGSLVLRDRRELGGAGGLAPISGSEQPAPAWDVTAVTQDDLATVRQFLVRRGGLAQGPRGRLAAQLAEGLRPKVGGAPALPDEHFLEGLHAAKTGGR